MWRSHASPTNCGAAAISCAPDFQAYQDCISCGLREVCFASWMSAPPVFRETNSQIAFSRSRALQLYRARRLARTCGISSGCHFQDRPSISPKGWIALIASCATLKAHALEISRNDTVEIKCCPVHGDLKEQPTNEDWGTPSNHGSWRVWEYLHTLEQKAWPMGTTEANADCRVSISPRNCKHFHHLTTLLR